jgi:GxxExxY protein|nr:MAG TPA: PD-(D/E)XK nuclease superfamily protein [Caudoviricetes sp.]
MNTFYYKEETYKIRGAIFAVHKELGNGFLERVYQDALEFEFQARGIPYEREKEIQIMYKGKPLGEPYRADFVCYGNIIIELKAVEELQGIHRSQVINYLKATGMKLGLLVNFGEELANIERIVRYK